MFQEAAALLRQRGETVIDPSDECRSWTNVTAYSRHVDYSLALMPQADALIVLPGGLDGRLASLMVEYALMVAKPVMLMSRKGGVEMPDFATEAPLWTSRVMHRGEGEDVL